jgi:hypothetical protein
MTATIFELKERLGEGTTKLLNESFELAARSQEVDISMRPETLERLGDRRTGQIRGAERAAWVTDERLVLKASYEVLWADYYRQRDERVGEIEGLLAPKFASTQLVLDAVRATPEELLNLADISLDIGDEDGLLLALKAARQRDDEAVVSHILTLREDLGALFGELTLVAGDPDIDVADRFELLAAQVPTESSLLAPRGGNSMAGMG